MEKNLVLYLKHFFSGTLLSRCSGMARDLVMAFAFGAHPSVAAFIIAFRLSNLFRRLIGEGPFQSAFIPHFENLRIQDPFRAVYFFRKLVVLVIFLLLSMTILAEGGLAILLSHCNLSTGNAEIAILIGWLFPGILFICLYGLNISLLNCYDSFFLPSFAPFICNVVWIIAAFLLKNTHPTIAMPILAKWVVIGLLGQWLITLPPTLKYVSAPWKEWLSLKIPTEVKDLAKSFSLGSLGVGAIQINAVFDAFFSRYADIQGPAYLWYSIRLQQLAFAVFGLACIHTIVPRLSRAIKSRQFDNAQYLFTLSYKKIMLLMIPCMFAILSLGAPSVNLIFGRGNFSEVAIIKTTLCLWAYGLGLIPMTLILLFSAICYAQNNFRTPMLISLLTILINLVLSSLFVFCLKWGAVSTALSTAFSALINSLILYKVIRDKGWQTDFHFSRILKLSLASLFATFCVISADHLLFHSNLFLLLFKNAYSFPKSLLDQVICFSSLFFIFIGGFLLYMTASRNKDLTDFFQSFFKTKEKIS